MIIIRSMPLTNFIHLATTAAWVIFNLCIILLHSYNNALLEQWMRFSQPGVDVMSRYVLAINKISLFMVRVGYGDRVDIVRNVISCDWIIYTVGFVVASVSCLVDFLINGRNISDLIYKRFSAAIEGKFLYSTGIAIYFVFWVLCLFLIFSDTGYSQLYLYQSDVSLATAIIFFYGALVIPIAMFALCISRAWEAVRRFNPRSPQPPRGHH